MDHQYTLKRELQNATKAPKLEHLAAALLSRLLDVPIAVARSGFQYGADAGPAGQHGRRFRIECKKYSDTSNLSERELLGEIDQALARDEALEAWVLVATCNVPEQLRQSLHQHGERMGVPIIIIDWAEHEMAPLAALCASAPDLVGAKISEEAEAAARALQPMSGMGIERLRRDLQSWCLGFKKVRARSHQKLAKIWSLPRESNAALGQNAAGGAQEKKVKRKTVHEALNAWWQGPAQEDAPAAVVGWEGAGKTWATLDWLMDRKDEHPIVLTIPSSALAASGHISETDVKQLLAKRLHEMSGVRDQAHWPCRLGRLLLRPVDEGPVLTVFFDGLNQEPSVQWLSLLKVLQGETFAGRVRIIVSTRTHHFENRLANLRGLIVPAVRTGVDFYDTALGGELDQMLAFEGLSQADLHPEVLRLARRPRLFALVVRFRKNLVESNQITVHRLLWEYGRDTFGERAGKSFSEDEWKEWLKEVARQCRDNVPTHSEKSLAETVSRPDLAPSEVYARLSDIIDGRFVTHNTSGDLQLDPMVVAHALGAALLAHLDQVVSPTFESLDAELAQWFDPIAGFDEQTEILRAAVSILVEQGQATNSPVSGVLVTAWLQSQNISDEHRRELVDLAPNFPNALLDTVEYSDISARGSARSWAVKALRTIPRTDTMAFSSIVKRARHWLSRVSRGVKTNSEDVETEKWRSDYFKRRIGTDSSGPVTVVGVELELVDQTFGSPKNVIPSIIEGFPLAEALPIFEVAAIATAIPEGVIGHDESWNGLQWLCLLNEIDADATAEALRDLSRSVCLQTPELGIHRDIPARIAALLLWLTGQEADEDAAVALDRGLDQPSYEQEYLSQPGRSFWFSLERRHAAVALNDTTLPVVVRTQRIGELWLDPHFEPPTAFLTELRTAAARVNIEELDRHSGLTRDDHTFNELEPALARCAPDLLADLIRRKMRSIATRPLEARYWSAISATAHLVLAGKAEAAAARTLRLSAKENNENNERNAATHLLLTEVEKLEDAQAQFDVLIRADLEAIPDDFAQVLDAPTPDDVDALIARYTAGPAKQQHDLLTLLSIHQVELTDNAWTWVEGFTNHQDDHLQGIAFRILACADPKRFGRILESGAWSWHPDKHGWVNHYGTGALIEATLALPFDQVVSRLAPWRLLEAARLRGAKPPEVRLAADIFDQALMGNNMEEPDPGANLSINRARNKLCPFTITVAPRLNEEEDALSLRLALDEKAQTRALQHAVDTAVSCIREAQHSGANLYLVDIGWKDFLPVLQHAPDMVERWLEGFHEPTAEFQRRVRLAEGAYLALCEALLMQQSERGAPLWRALRASVITQYRGAADVDDLLHLIFRVPDSPSVVALRAEVADLDHCHTDPALFDLAFAASYNDKADWLTALIDADRVSEAAWRRKRGTVLAGFTVNNTLPAEGAWPDGEVKTNYAGLTLMAARSQWSEACAHHWWRTFLKADNPTEAYAAWVLFLRSADRRAWAWMDKDVEAIAKASNDFFTLKMAHAELNREELKRAMKKRDDKLDRNFLYRRIVSRVGPWI